MKTILDYLTEEVAAKEQACKYETAKGYRTLLNHLERYLRGRKLCFAELREAELIRLEVYLRDRGCRRNTTSLYVRRLHSLHRRASCEGEDYLPEGLYSCVFTGEEATVNHPLSSGQLRQIRDFHFEPGQRHLMFARDLFMLSFYLRGIPFIDLAHLRHNDLRGGVLYYSRHKTGNPTAIKLEKCAVELIERYRNTPKTSPYLLPIIKYTEGRDEHKRYESALRLYNKHLAIIGNLTGIEERLSSYTPRYSWANVAHEQGIDFSFISEGLCHSSEKTTRHYVRTFHPDVLAAKNQQVIGTLDKPDEKGKPKEPEQRGNQERPKQRKQPVCKSHTRY